MIYIVCNDFKSTSGNHAGMRHLYEQICQSDANTKLYVLNKNGVGVKKMNRVIAFYTALKLVLSYKKGDKFLFTEYMFKGSFHSFIISFIKIFYPEAPIYAMAHLTPRDIEKHYSIKQIRKEAARVNKIITLGSSLTKYFNGLGVNNVYTSFHYVNNSYYKVENIVISEKPKVIVMGAMARDFNMLADIVKRCQSVNFTIFKGRKNIDELFLGCDNLKLIGFVPEEVLRKEMTTADISLNVMVDTIGSNVICTSLAMGLAMLCSDVGSIRDYCDESNTIFCKTTNDFVDAINNLSHDVDKLKSMRQNALYASKRLSIDKYKMDIWNLLGEI